MNLNTVINYLKFGHVGSQLVSLVWLNMLRRWINKSKLLNGIINNSNNKTT